MKSFSNAGNWVKKHPILSIVFFIVILAACGLLSLYLYDTKPWKVKDPSNPRFEVSKFDPNDYLNHQELAVALRQILRPGVSTITDVDMLWCKKTPCGKPVDADSINHSSLEKCKQRSSESDLIEYAYPYSQKGKSPIFGGWIIWIFLNSDETIQQICADDTAVY